MPAEVDRIYRKVVKSVRKQHPDWDTKKVVSTAWAIAWSQYKKSKSKK